MHISLFPWPSAPNSLETYNCFVYQRAMRINLKLQMKNMDPCIDRDMYKLQPANKAVIRGKSVALYIRSQAQDANFIDKESTVAYCLPEGLSESKWESLDLHLPDSEVHTSCQHTSCTSKIMKTGRLGGSVS